MTFLAAALAQLPVALLGLNLEQFLLDTGPWVLVVSAIIVFIESGVLFPVLPGDSLIFALGMLHQQMGLSLWVAFPVLVIVAMAGAEVGYQIGARYGRNIFKDDAKIVRTFVSLAAGISSYDRKKFHLWNTVGAIAWIGVIGLAGVLLGGIPFVHNNIEYIAVIIVLVSVVPVFIEYLRGRSKAKRESAE